MGKYRLCYGNYETCGYDTFEAAVEGSKEVWSLGFTPIWIGKYNEEKDKYEIIARFETK